MGTRTNFYKNPSYTYNKDFDLNSVIRNLKAYNAATGTPPPVEHSEPVAVPDVDEKIVRKRHRPPKLVKRNEVEENDGPMSHQDYIEKRRKEVNLAQALEELPANVLEASSSVIQLVEYDSDRSTSSEFEEKQELPSTGLGSDICEKQQDPLHSDNMDAVDQVKKRSKQRFAVPGEPVCVVCGKYGEYICDETDDDICSTDCKTELLENIKLQQRGSLSNQISTDSSGSELLSRISETGGDTWDYNRHRWSTKRSSLCTYECWKCRRPGHLAEDCLVMASNLQSLSSDEKNVQAAISPKRSSFISRDLLELYKRCHQIGRKCSDVKCNSCASSSTLAACIQCSITLCDGAGHLSEHIKKHPSHQQYYSYRLKRLVKCCKPTCKVTDIKDLLACHYCFDKAFDKFYDMYTATWKGAGLSIIWSSICCEDHFAWHRMNCVSASVEDSAYIVKKHDKNATHVQMSDFIF